MSHQLNDALHNFAKEWVKPSPAYTEVKCGHQVIYSLTGKCAACPIETPASTEEWEQELQELLERAGTGEVIDLKGFIRSHDQQLRQRIVEEAERMKKDVRPEIKVWLNGNRETNEEYNQALSDIQFLITNLK